MIQIPLQLEAGIEVMVASLGERAAAFTLKYDARQGFRAIGRGGFLADDLEKDIGPSDQLTEVLRRIWKVVMQTEDAPMPFGDTERKRSEARLKGREARKETRYSPAAQRFLSPGPLWWALSWDDAETQWQACANKPAPVPQRPEGRSQGRAVCC